MCSIVLTLIVSLAQSPLANSSLITPEPIGGGGSRAVDSIMTNHLPYSLCYDSANDWFWVLGDDTPYPCVMFTVDRQTGVQEDRFMPSVVASSEEYYPVTCSFDEVNNHLYVVGQNSPTSQIWCIDVSDPDSPELVGKWTLPYLIDIYGIEYRAPYFYASYETTLREYSLIPNEDPELVSEIEVGFLLSGTYYDEAYDVFYCSLAMAPETVFCVLDGDNPANVLLSWMVEDELWHLSWGCPTKDADGYLWKVDMENLQIRKYEDEYEPSSSFQSCTWASLKTLF